MAKKLVSASIIRRFSRSLINFAELPVSDGYTFGIFPSFAMGCSPHRHPD